MSMWRDHVLGHEAHLSSSRGHGLEGRVSFAKLGTLTGSRGPGPSSHQVRCAFGSDCFGSGPCRARATGSAAPCQAYVDASMSVPFHGVFADLPLGGRVTNLPSLTCMNQPQSVGCALPNDAALMSTGAHAR